MLVYHVFHGCKMNSEMPASIPIPNLTSIPVAPVTKIRGGTKRKAPKSAKKKSHPLLNLFQEVLNAAKDGKHLFPRSTGHKSGI